ncbi:hypothetical protein [Clostridium sardiniense]|uniref:hypothetical protein n=1 Tax=Clostridium sardiniense TaxID=29369 RepID=UPI00195872ED|nr:hypothetical protein [Clostridium sardiniense]MBM7835715.1 hypothetical protein [Clostridium sardiniense]
MDFNNLKDLYSDISKKREIILETLGEVASDVLDETIEKVVYDGDFQPNFYERRYKNKGYGDRENINTEIISPGIIQITNETLANGDEKGERLDSIIEYGESYGWNRQPDERPVFDITKQKLNQSGILEKVVKKELNLLGFETE